MKHVNEVFQFISYRLKSGQEAPTLQEIADKVKLKSLASVHKILVKLEEDKKITRTRKVRGIHLVPDLQNRGNGNERGNST